MTGEEAEERLGMFPTAVRRGDLFVSPWLGRYLLALTDPIPGETLYGVETVRIVWLVADPHQGSLVRPIDYVAERRPLAIALLVRRAE